MAVFIPAKHYASSGSDHDGAASTSGDPSCFSALLNYFLDPTSGDHPHHTNDSEGEIDSPIPNPSIPALAIGIASPSRSLLVSEVESAAKSAAGLPGSVFRRSVMARLRERGFNAGICKARWDSCRGLTAGSYEYIDVVVMAEGKAEEIRFIVDLGFAAEFEVARATEEYRRVAAALPEVAVASPEEVRAAVAIMAEAARRSFKSRGMSVPPWRKKRYLMAKWLGFYRRTVNVGKAAEEGREWEAKCRAVGFGWHEGEN